MVGDRMIATLLPIGLLAAEVPRDQACPPETSSWVCGPVYDSLGSSWAVRAEWLVAKPLTVLMVLMIAFVINRVVRHIIKRSLNKLLQPPSERTRRAQRILRRAAPAALLRTSNLNLRIDARVQTLTTVFRSIASVLVWFVAAVTSLQVIGVNIASLITIGSVAGVAVGFGAQHVVRDFLAGMFIVLEDQFGVGDVVDIGGDARGTVEELTLRTTRVRDVNGTVWHVPNGQIERVANKTQEWARAVLDVEVDGATDYAVAAPLIQQVAEGMAGEEQWMADVLTAPELWGVESFTEAGYTIRLVIKTRPATQFGVLRELRIRLLRAFDEKGIVLPGAHWSLEHHGRTTLEDVAKVIGVASANGADARDGTPPAADGASAGKRRRTARAGAARRGADGDPPADRDADGDPDAAAPAPGGPPPPDPDTAAPHPRRGDPHSEA
jgi:small-conductance mechanosensitive channel